MKLSEKVDALIRWAVSMEKKIDRINRRTKLHTLDIQELKKCLKHAQTKANKKV